jgi:Ca-activated chloride channel family protein
MGLANSIRQLKESDAKSKVIVLLTDGVNNAGRIDPLTAAEMAKALGIRVYTIGVGSKGPTFVRGGPFGGLRVGDVEFDRETLEQIARMTEGRFYHADSDRKLKDIFGEIDEMEKTKIKTKEYQYYDELMEKAVVPALVLLLLELGLGYTRFRKLP